MFRAALCGLGRVSVRGVAPVRSAVPARAWSAIAFRTVRVAGISCITSRGRSRLQRHIEYQLNNSESWQ